MASNVAKKEQSTALSTEFNMEDFAGAGLENVSSAELSTPFFRLLQALSPETKKSDPAHIPGASEGMWVDVVGRAAYDSILFVPVNYVTTFMEWKPRSAGGGLVANHGTDRSILQRCQRDPNTKRLMTAAGNEMVETHNWYGIVVSGRVGGEDLPIFKEAVIALSGTQSQTNRKWLTFSASQKKARPDGSLYTPPMFAIAYRLASTPTKNEQGSWALATFAPEGWTQDLPNAAALLPQVVHFLKQAKDMEKEIVAQAQADAETSAGPNAAPMDDGIPF